MYNTLSCHRPAQADSKHSEPPESTVKYKTSEATHQAGTTDTKADAARSKAARPWHILPARMKWKILVHWNDKKSFDRKGNPSGAEWLGVKGMGRRANCARPTLMSYDYHGVGNLTAIEHVDWMQDKAHAQAKGRRKQVQGTRARRACASTIAWARHAQAGRAHARNYNGQGICKQVQGTGASRLCVDLRSKGLCHQKNTLVN